MKNKKLRQDVSESEDFDEDVEERVNLKKKGKKGKKGKEEKIEKKKLLIETIDDELNQIEYCNFNDINDKIIINSNVKSVDSSVNFNKTHTKSYFETYFIDKLIDAKSDNTNELKLNNLNLNDEHINMVNNTDALIKNEHFIYELKNRNGGYLDVSNKEMLKNELKILYLNNIEILDLSGNKLDSIPFQLIKLFKNLNKLKLNNNLISYDGQTIDLYDDDNNKRITNFKTIEYLTLENNRIKNNLSFLSFFKNLNYLNMSNNLIDNLKLNLITSLVRNLIDLNVSLNKQQQQLQAQNKREYNDEHESQYFDEIDSNDDYYLSLRKISLKSMNLNNLIYNLRRFKNLEILILDDNNLEFIPTQIYELDSLKHLSLNSNKIYEISEKFCSYAKFQANLLQLSLNNNSLITENFNEKFYLFKNLLKLDLSYNKFKFIPNTLPDSLQELRINNNKLFTLLIKPVRLLNEYDRYMNEINGKLTNSDDDGVSATKGVNKNFSVDSESIENLRQRFINSTSTYTNHHEKHDHEHEPIYTATSVFYLRNLNYLDLSSNQIQELPLDFGLLNVSLKYLNLSSNLIKQLDIKLCCRGLYNLKYLNLNSNFIKYIPEQICEFKKLEYLYLNNNLIQYLNYELCNELDSLIELDLSFNKLCELPLFTYKNGKIKVVNISSIQSVSHNNNATNASTKTINGNLNGNGNRGELESAVNHNNLFTFGLKNVKKIFLNSNKLQSPLPFQIAFSQCVNLNEINLSNNFLTRIQFENHDNDSNEANNINNGDAAFNATGDLFYTKIKKNLVLKNLHSINLSNNHILLNDLDTHATTTGNNNNELNVNKRFLKFLLKFYKIAPNLRVFMYDQLNGTKLNTQTTSVAIAAATTAGGGVTTRDDANESNLNLENKDLVDEEILINYSNEYDFLTNNLQIINLSNNNLTKIPTILYQMNNLKEVYLNGNYINKIPSNLIHQTRTVSFIEAKKLIPPREPITNEESSTQSISKNSIQTVGDSTLTQSNGNFKDDTSKSSHINVSSKTAVSALPMITQNIEILELNDNKLEQIPENLFIHFKNLKDLKLRNNPLREPPKGAMCANFIDDNKDDNNESSNNSSSVWADNYESLIEEYEKNVLLSESTNFNSDQKMTAMRSYMIRYKRREELLLVNMFATIKDEIDSQDTLFKLMRRLKMPMDKVEIVCNEIAESVKLNWAKRAEKDKSIARLRKKDLIKAQREFTLKIQTWKLLNIWRQLYGVEAQSDELLRVIKLMNSNEHEEALLNKLEVLKYTSNALKI